MTETDYINKILNMPRVPKMPKFWLWQSSEYGRVLNMPMLHSVLNIPEYAWSAECISGSEYARTVNMVRS